MIALEQNPAYELIVNLSNPCKLSCGDYLCTKKEIVKVLQPIEDYYTSITFAPIIANKAIRNVGFIFSFYKK